MGVKFHKKKSTSIGWVSDLRVRQTFVLVAIIIPTICTPVAAHNQSLTWGYVEGTHYNYKESYYSVYNETSSFVNEMEFYILGPAYPNIKDPISINDPFPFVRSHEYYPNGTLISSYESILAVPTGNWSLLSTLAISFKTSEVQVNIVESSDIWSFTLHQEDFIYSWIQTVEFSKNDGVLLRNHIESSTSRSILIYDRERIIPGLTSLEVALTLAAGISVAIVLALYHRKMRR